MNCEKYTSLIPGYYDGELETEKIKNFESHLNNCPQCQKQLQQHEILMATIQNVHDEIPHWSIQQQFLNALGNENQQMPRVRKVGRSFKKFLPYAAAVIFLAAGYVLGSWNPEKEGIADLKQDVQEMKQLVMVSMLKQESASERIQAVNYSQDFSNPSEEVINTLIKTINRDESPNVRIAAINALQRYGDNEVVRMALLNSFSFQQNPAVQISLINVLVDIKEKRALEIFNEIIEDQDLIDEVRKQAALGAENLI